MRLLTSLLLAALLGLGTAACGSSSTDAGGTTTDTSSNADNGGTGTEDAGGTGTADNGGTESDTTATGGDENQMEPDAADTSGTEDTGGTTGTEDTGDTTGGTDDTGGTTGADAAPACDLPTTFEAGGDHVVTLQVVKDAADYQCDSNNDGTVDATDGNLNALLTGSLVSAMVDVNKSLQDSVNDRSLIFLGEIKGYSGSDATGLTANLYSGAKEDKQPDPTCDDIANADQTCDWYISANSFNDQCMPLVTLPDATVSGGKLAAGPNDFQFTFVFSGTPLNLKVKHGRITAEVADTWTADNGRICGTVMKDDLLAAFAAACAGDNPPSFCSFQGVLGGLINCGSNNECNIVLSFTGKPAKSLALEPQQ